MPRKLIRCRQGHVFDGAIHKACPTCGETVAVSDDPEKKSSDSPRRDDTVVPRPTPRRRFSRPMFAAGPGLLIVCAVSAWLVLRSSPPASLVQSQTTLPPSESGKPVAPQPLQSATTAEPAKPSNQQTSAAPPKQAVAPVTNTPQQMTPPSSDQHAPLIAERTSPSSPNTSPPATQAPAPQSDVSAPVAWITAIEDKYAFSSLAREIVATSQGAYAYDRKDYAAAKAWFSTNETKNNPVAIFYRAQMAETGNGARRDSEAALRLFTESANAGFYWAQLRLGKIYSKGDFPGVTADPQKAKPWLMMAAKEYRGEANRLLAEMGVPNAEIKPTRIDLEKALGSSYQEALAIANKLASQGVGSANYWAGSFIFRGEGTPANPTLGRELMMKAARLYDAPAMIEVALWSLTGNGVIKNQVEAATIGYISRENVVYPADGDMIDKRISKILDGIPDEKFNDVRKLLKGIRDIPARASMQ